MRLVFWSGANAGSRSYFDGGFGERWLNGSLTFVETEECGLIKQKQNTTEGSIGRKIAKKNEKKGISDAQDTEEQIRCFAFRTPKADFAEWLSKKKLPMLPDIQVGHRDIYTHWACTSIMIQATRQDLPGTLSMATCEMETYSWEFIQSLGEIHDRLSQLLCPGMRAHE